MSARALHRLEAGGVHRRDVDLRPAEDVAVGNLERDRAAVERIAVQTADLAAGLILDSEDRHLEEALRPDLCADPADAPLDAVGRGRGGVHAGPGRPALALDLELGLVRVVAQKLELLEARLQAELAPGGGHGVVAALCLGGAATAFGDLDAQLLD